MMTLMVINTESDYKGQSVTVDRMEWESGKLWVSVKLNGKMTTLARHSLGWDPGM